MHARIPSEDDFGRFTDRGREMGVRGDFTVRRELVSREWYRMGGNRP